MSVKLHSLPKRLGKKRKRVGRGNASGHGTYSTRGIKGQKARSGVSGLKLKGMKHIILSTPKLKGFQSVRGKAITLTFEKLNKYFADGDVVSPETLVKVGALKNLANVKIVIRGELEKKLEVKGCEVSKGAREVIEKVGGKVE